MIPGISVFLINLDRSPERLALMANRLERHQLEWTRVSAVEGRLLDINNEPSIDLAGYRRKHGKLVNPAELGCYLSHIKCLRAFLDDPDKSHALILEDDVDLAPNFTGAVSAAVELKDRWDMLKLSGFHSGTPVGGIITRAGNQICKMLSRHTGSAAYIVNRKAASVYLSKLLPMSVPYDHNFDQGWRLGLRVRLLHPMPTVLDGSASTIGGATSAYTPFAWHRRFPTYAYRASTELRRVAHGLLEWWLD